MPSADDLRYLRMTPQELELTIGASLLEDTFGAKPTTDVEKRSAAAEWFHANLGRFRRGLCGNHWSAKTCSEKTSRIATYCLAP
jgi:hypothetical protein